MAGWHFAWRHTSTLCLLPPEQCLPSKGIVSRPVDCCDIAALTKEAFELVVLVPRDDAFVLDSSYSNNFSLTCLHSQRSETLSALTTQTSTCRRARNTLVPARPRQSRLVALETLLRCVGCQGAILNLLTHVSERLWSTKGCFANTKSSLPSTARERFARLLSLLSRSITCKSHHDECKSSTGPRTRGRGRWPSKPWQSSPQ